MLKELLLVFDAEVKGTGIQGVQPFVRTGTIFADNHRMGGVIAVLFCQKLLESGDIASILEKTPYVCGGTHWNFIDFSSALRDESMPRINNKGLAYSDRTPKDVF